MVNINKKVFCRGLFCKKSYRKKKCLNCNVFVCSGKCSGNIDNKRYCIDCYIEKQIKEQWEEILLEFLEMFEEKNTKEVKTIIKA